jgi:DNA-binding NarL/FixJ family response regulator
MDQDIPLRIMLVDDEPLILFTLQQIIENTSDMNVVGHATDGRDALMRLQVCKPDVILLDIQMPHMSGIECMQYIHNILPDAVIVLLTTFDDEEYIIEGLANGARSYLLKSAKFEDLIKHIREAYNGTFVMPNRIASKLAAMLQHKKNSKPTLPVALLQTYALTRTEQQILLLLGKRFSNNEIAEQLSVHVGTVRNHLVAIFEKMNVRNRQEAIAIVEAYLNE